VNMVAVVEACTVVELDVTEVVVDVTEVVVM
jgi:hypothetical protein